MNQDAFHELVQRHRRLIHKVAATYCRRPADRDDVVQEIVLQLWRSRERFDPSARSSTWVYRVALNVAISFYRRELRHTDQAQGVERQPEESLVDRGLEPSAMAAESDELRVLRGCIEELGELDRALVLLYLDHNNHAAIADVLGISSSNVGTKLARIKTQLKRCFDEHANPSSN